MFEIRKYLLNLLPCESCHANDVTINISISNEVIVVFKHLTYKFNDIMAHGTIIHELVMVFCITL